MMTTTMLTATSVIVESDDDLDDVDDRNSLAMGGAEHAGEQHQHVLPGHEALGNAGERRPGAHRLPALPTRAQHAPAAQRPAGNDVAQPVPPGGLPPEPQGHDRLPLQHDQRRLLQQDPVSF